MSKSLISNWLLFAAIGFAQIDSPVLPPKCTATRTTNCTVTTSTTGAVTSGSPKIVVQETVTTSPRGILSMQFSTGIDGARVGFAKARGSISVPTTLLTGDTIGRLMFRGFDGTNYLEMASIEAVATGTVAPTRIPTELRFYTGTDAAPSVLTQRMVIDKAGNVGIGTTTPRSILDIQAASDVTLQFGKNGSAVGRLAFADASNASDIAQFNAYDYQFLTGSSVSGATEKVRINTNGNVGIGTTFPTGAPVSKLTTVGSATFYDASSLGAEIATSDATCTGWTLGAGVVVGVAIRNYKIRKETKFWQKHSFS